MSLPGDRYARVLTVVLLLEATAFYAIASRPERAPPVSPLTLFPSAFSGWAMARDVPTEKEVQEVLKADDTLNRVYVDSSRTDYAYLFIAYFKTQRYGQAPHSPKNCLPGSGWEPVETGRQTVERSRLERAHCDEPVRGGARRRQERGVVLVPDPQSHHRQRVLGEVLAGGGFHSLRSQRYFSGEDRGAGP